MSHQSKKQGSTIDLSQYPVVDSHCHPFLPGKEEKILVGKERIRKRFDQLFGVSLFPNPKLHTENVIFYRKAMKELARVLGCPFKFDMIIKRRNEVYANPREYIMKLFDEAKIDTLLLDMGFPSEMDPATGYSVPLGEFQNLVNCKLRCIYRIEQLLFDLYQTAPPFEDLLEHYEESLEHAVKREGYVGFKTIIAYDVGLEIHIEDERAARAAYERLREKKLLTEDSMMMDRKTRSEAKILYNYLICRSIEKSIDLEIPFQIHTGFGDTPIDVRAANPLHLFEVITDEELGKAQFVLIHAGYPYVEETGLLANTYPNVYIDLSEMMPFIGPGMKEKVLQLLYMAPTTKIMFGSDGYNNPEIFWIAAIWGKQAISEALQDLVRSDAIDEDYAYKAGSLILSENAIRLYKL